MDNLTGTFQKNAKTLDFQLQDKTTLSFFKKEFPKPTIEPVLYLLFQNQNLVEVTLFKKDQEKDFDEGVMLSLPENMEPTHVVAYFQNLLKGDSGEVIPPNLYASLEAYKENLLSFLTYFHLYFPENKPKKKPAKAQHRFKKEFAAIPFFVDDFDSKAIIHWEKRNLFRIEKGAKLKPDIPLNKNGELGLSAKMGLQLRQEQADNIKNNQTTDDIFLKSVNEIGLFLYFAQTNSWLILKDENGRSIDDYSVIK